jgi:hypothetical protein
VVKQVIATYNRLAADWLTGPQALVKAQSNPAYTSIMESTHSVIFFGTPHQGSELASWGTILQNIGTVLSYQQRSPLLETLKANCPKLEDLRDDFRHQAIRYKIVSCFEQKATRPLNSLVSAFSRRV